MKKQALILAVMMAGMLGVGPAAGDIPTTTGDISKVTVYRGQALVTRTIGTDLPAGTSELIVAGLPARIIPESLFAQTSGNTKVLSVRYRERAVKEDTREEVKALEAEIEELTRQLAHVDGDLKHLHQQWDNMFCRLREFTVNAASSDLNRGLLTFKPIKELVTFIEEKGLGYHKQATEWRDQIDGLKKELELLKRKRAQLDEGRSRTEREAVLFISKADKNSSSIELNYLVNGANWLPQYNVRGNPVGSAVVIEYNAIVNQVSGEDWTGVSLSLSTAEPAMVAAAPMLEPMGIILARQGGQRTDMPAQMDQRTESQAGRRSGLTDRSEDFKRLARSRRAQSKKGAAAQVELQQLAVDNQTWEFNLSRRELEKVKEEISEITRIESVSVTYDLPSRLTLPSRTDQQLVTIASVGTKGEFTLVATPLLTDYVYLQAEIVNDSEIVFLPGPASMFRNGEFVGKSDLPIVTIGEKLTAGFGIDSQVQMVRELEDKKTKIQGGNRIDTYKYRIALSNYKNVPAPLRLLDRLPYTEGKSVKIELLSAKPELSKDSEYLRTSRKKGILRWELNLAANSVEQDVTVVNYGFTMEYDKNMQIRPGKAN